MQGAPGFSVISKSGPVCTSGLMEWSPIQASPRLLWPNGYHLCPDCSANQCLSSPIHLCVLGAPSATALDPSPTGLAPRVHHCRLPPLRSSGGKQEVSLAASPYQVFGIWLTLLQTDCNRGKKAGRKVGPAQSQASDKYIESGTKHCRRVGEHQESQWGAVREGLAEILSEGEELLRS